MIRLPTIEIVPDQLLRRTPTRSFNRLCDISDWRANVRLTEIMRELGNAIYIHRKAWEYSLCIEGLEALGAYDANSRGLAVGAAWERPLYYFSNRIRKMVATDIYQWSEGTNEEPLAQLEKLRPFEFRREHLPVLAMSGDALGFADNVFDFAFSLSSIEHFGGRNNSKRAVQEMYRVLKPGGITCIATELILNGVEHPEYFLPEELESTVLQAAPFELVGGDWDLKVSRSLLENPIDLKVEENLHVSPHIVMKLDTVIFTSILFFLRKPKRQVAALASIPSAELLLGST